MYWLVCDRRRSQKEWTNPKGERPPEVETRKEDGTVRARVTSTPDLIIPELCLFFHFCEAVKIPDILSGEAMKVGPYVAYP